MVGSGPVRLGKVWYGHGKLKPSCLVDIKSENILNKLGYELHEYTERNSRGGHYEVYLKTDIQKEMS